MFEFRRTDVGELSVLGLSGSLNALTAEKLRIVINELIQMKRAFIILDLSCLDLIDSSGVGALVSLFKRVQSFDGQVKFACLQGQPYDIFKLLNLHKAFDIAFSMESAIQAFPGGLYDRLKSDSSEKLEGILNARR